jgi:hypothetical protein
LQYQTPQNQLKMADAAVHGQYQSVHRILDLKCGVVAVVVAAHAAVWLDIQAAADRIV